MKIVIDIPDDVYKRTVFYREFKELNDYVTTLKALENGTPLPKGHGRLIDVDAIRPIKAPIAPLTQEDSVHYEWVYIKSRIDNAPTIIETDKEGEE